MNDVDAIRQALAKLVESGELRPEQVEPVSLAVGEALRDRGAGDRVGWSEILAYVGGGLVLAGATAFVALGWDRMTQPTRITVLAVVTVLLLAVAAGLGRTARSATGRTAAVQGRVAATLAALGSGTAALCAGVAADRYEGLIAGAAGLVVAAVAYVLLPTAIGLLACGGFALLTVTGLLDVFAGQEGGGWGLAYIALGVVILVLALAGLLAPRDLGLGMGAAIALFGGQWPVLWDGDAWGYWLTAVIALACLALYGRRRTWVLIVSGVAGLTLAVPEAVWDWTDGAVGGAVILVLAGAVLLAASGLGVVLHRRASQQ
ncbi:hypothetical protein OG884_30590 [Streptosporangium sp. NBC_01755]|uniref:hypothetical protein n=1 Tax=unclassified Streptosporangium TaxID=2632669 RepID=UPI002DD884AC|nr:MULTISPECIES: hypothetical protein [unclassified Streptosporangium]WSA29402.1 hypothetical protein OIE13_16885 [Streptosporangium sp. NBC_01810]WSC99154.1 hypothetical protein OG884_30590 [Streptosporangium sp. NBC_01755]